MARKVTRRGFSFLSGILLSRRSGSDRAQARRALVSCVLLVALVPVAGASGAAAQSESSGDTTAEVSETATGAWWDGSATLAAASPGIVEQGWCSSYGGWLGLFAGGPLSKVCHGSGGATPGAVSGSPHGVGWFEGFGADGLYVGVELFGAPTVAADAYRTLGEMDVIFEGGIVTVDLSLCAHRAGDGWSSCRTLVVGASLPLGVFVGTAVSGTQVPAMSLRGAEFPETPAIERSALIALYDSAGGRYWRRKSNWTSSAPVSEWYGVTTNSAGSVTHLYLFSNNMTGGLPAELGSLTNLEELVLSNNRLGGGIPAELGDLNNLRVLNLTLNDLSGSVPVELADLTSLEILGLGGNRLSGSIPTELGELSNLATLALWSNRLSGSIPAELGDLTNLETLSLSGPNFVPFRNRLSGSIPTELGDLTNLESLYLGRNNLSGSIPAELGDLTELEVLSLFDNSLTGGIPAELGDLTNLKQLTLSENSLSGNIPPELGQLTNLEYLLLDGNGLSGSMPPEIGVLTSLQQLSLSENDLTGSIPTTLGGLINLELLYLYDNSLSGGIPAELGDLSALRFLNLSSNSLSGRIPAELGELRNLLRLDLSDNGLSGAIPGEVGDLNSLSDLNLSDNSLSGAIPLELSDLASLRTLDLSGNSLSGSIPLELGDLRILRYVDLSENSFTGCVPANLAPYRIVLVDSYLSYCGPIELLGAVLVDGTAVELIYDSDLDESSIPQVDTFSISIDGASQTISAVTISGRAVTLRLASPVTATGTVTVSYTAPTDTDAARIENTNGDAAEGFTAQPVMIPPDLPTITSVESVTGGLEVQWSAVAGISGYDVEWRHDTETMWQSSRIDQQQHTIGGLADGALYWVRLRAVKTTGGLTAQTLYTTAWSAPEPGIASDWTPRNLQVEPGDRMLTVIWDDVSGTTGYEVEYWRRGEPSRSQKADAVRDGQGWAAHIVGLDNGTTYDVRVQSVRHLNPDATLPPSYDRALASGWVTGEGTPSVVFVVDTDASPRFVRAGNAVERAVRLVYDDGDDGDDDSDASDQREPRPLASRSMGARILTGPSSGQRVQCRAGAAPEQVADFVEATGDSAAGSMCD